MMNGGEIVDENGVLSNGSVTHINGKRSTPTPTLAFCDNLTTESEMAVTVPVSVSEALQPQAGVSQNASSVARQNYDGQAVSVNHTVNNMVDDAINKVRCSHTRTLDLNNVKLEEIPGDLLQLSQLQVRGRGLDVGVVSAWA